MLAGLVAGFGDAALAQSIYTCTDSRGQRITSDRPIAECNDRVQKELNPSGTVRRQIGPSLTAAERAAQEDKARQAIEERSRQADEKRMERALLSRYPNRAAHDKERAAALVQVEEVIKTANKRLEELGQQRKSIDAEFEFYKKDPSKQPPQLRRQFDENAQNVAAQKRFIADQEGERKRVNQRFDEELVKLRQLWATQGSATAEK